MNRAPQPSDHWWDNHARSCGGNFEYQPHFNANHTNNTSLTRIYIELD